MIFLITERYETVKEQYTDVLGKRKIDRLPLSMDCRENISPQPSPDIIGHHNHKKSFITARQ